ncbi:MAG: O-antigen ligase family protein [Solirubrobacterales bacterium]|nr:O-antigen ligase family protein [Solirubrobacterales bacterium]
MIQRVIALGAIAGPLPKAGVVVVAVLAAVVLLVSRPRTRALAMLAALVLAPVLLLADIWNSPQLRIAHRHPLLAVLAALVVLGATGGLALVIRRRAPLMGFLAVLALPFRVPIQAGGTTSNLLVPLYLVVAAGSLAFIVPALLSSDPESPEATHEAGWVERLIALYVVLYGLQSVYSSDFEKALQQMVFFYVPFALLFVALRRLEWTPRALQSCLRLLIALGVLFSAIGFVEYATKTIILNPKLVVANDLHAYFTVNSVFFDPDIFGRFLALVMILLATVLLYARRQREQAGASAVLCVLWGGLVLTLSRSSLGALLLGLAVLAALRWRPGRALAIAGAVVALGAAAIVISPKTFGLNQGFNGASSGRAGLVSGGLDLFGDRPLWGYGSGSFVSEYRAHHPRSSTLAASHTIPITVAAEQGLIGELAYLALVLAALTTLLRGARGDATRAAVGTAFLALVFHTMLYADFLEDPVTWALLGVGCALAARVGLERGGRREAAPAAGPAVAVA